MLELIAMLELFLGVAILTVCAGFMILHVAGKSTPKVRVLLIDDARNIKADFVARTFDEGIYALLNEGPWDILYLDHDLGDPDPSKTGYDIINFLEANPTLLPDKIVLVTSNPVGRKKMQSVIDRMYGRNYEN